MKKYLKVICVMLATLFIVTSSLNVFATGTQSTSSDSLSGIQVIGAFALLMVAILLPLVKKSHRQVAAK